jgi:hypothetical protein
MSSSALLPPFPLCKLMLGLWCGLELPPRRFASLGSDSGGDFLYLVWLV